MLANLSLLHLMALPKIVCRYSHHQEFLLRWKLNKNISILWQSVLGMVKPELLPKQNIIGGWREGQKNLTAHGIWHKYLSFLRPLLWKYQSHSCYSEIMSNGKWKPILFTKTFSLWRRGCPSCWKSRSPVTLLHQDSPKVLALTRGGTAMGLQDLLKDPSSFAVERPLFCRGLK